MRRLKILCIATAATTAVSVSSATAASAKEFHSEIPHTFLFGSQVEQTVFTFRSGTFKCSAMTVTGESTATPVPTLSVHPNYGTCKMFGQGVVIASAGCRFELSAEGRLDGIVECANQGYGGMVLRISSAECAIKIPNQVPGVGSVGYTNEGVGAGRSILLRWGLAQIKYEVEGPGTWCGTVGVYEGTNGASLTGTVALKGYENEAHTIQRGIWVE
jgi:hypothetical protein